MIEEKFLEYLGPEPDNLPSRWMSVAEPEDLDRAVKIVESCFGDEKLLKLYDQGDFLSTAQTKHDRGHAFAVRDVAVKLVEEYQQIHPGELDGWTTKVVLPLAAFLHDIGRAVDVKNHAVAGAAIMNIYLQRLRLPKEVIRRILRIIALHRSEQVLKMKFDDPAWAFVVIADKCVGDEDRVRPREARKLKWLRHIGLARFDWWHEAVHDRVNYAIKHAHAVIHTDRKIRKNVCLLKVEHRVVLRVRLDEKVARANELITLYSGRFFACVKAARYLKMDFRIEVNGLRYIYNDSTSSWRPVHQVRENPRVRHFAGDLMDCVQ